MFACSSSSAPQRVLLLGGTSEIGVAIVSALAEERSVEVGLVGRDDVELARAADSLASRGCSVSHVDGGLAATAVEAHRELIGRAFAALSEVDVAILAVGALNASAAPNEVAPASASIDAASAIELLDVNMRGAGSLLLHAAAALERAGRGTLVVISSAAAVRARRSNPAYGASKAGLDALARALGDSLAASGIEVLVVRPGFVRTRMTNGMREPPLACSKEAVAAATVHGLRRKASIVWAPRSMRWAMLLLALLPRPLYRRLPL